MKKKYAFRHFVLEDGVKKSIEPSQEDAIKDRCKLFVANMATGKEHELVEKEA